MLKSDFIDNFSRLYYCDLSAANGYKSRTISDAEKYKPIKLYFQEKIRENAQNSDFKEIESFLLDQSIQTNSYIPLLTLRCRVSNLIRISLISSLKRLSINKIVLNNQKKLRFDLLPYLLNDDGLKQSNNFFENNENSSRIGIRTKEENFIDESLNFENINTKLQNTKKKVFINWETMNKNLKINASYFPFSYEVITSFNNKLSTSLSNWTYQKVKSNKSFKQVLREFGVDFHSNWTLLSKSSPKALKNACSFLGIEDVDDELNYLLKNYLMNYPLAKKKYKAKYNTIIGWKPTNDFYLSLAPSEEFLIRKIKNTLDDSVSKNKKQNIWFLYKKSFTQKEIITRIESRLRKISEILRKYNQNKNNNVLPIDFYEDKNEDPLTRLETKEGIETLNIVNKLTNDLLLLNANKFIKQKLKSKLLSSEIDSDKQKAWELYCEGFSQREIANKCSRPQTWVSKLIQEKSLSRQVAEKILPKLKNQFREIVKRKNKLTLIVDLVNKVDFEPEILAFEKEINKKANLINKSDIYSKLKKFEKKLSKITENPEILDSKIEIISKFLLSKSEKSSSNYIQKIMKDAISK